MSDPSEEPTGVFHLLLEVQGHDTSVDQLVHKRASLPARQQVADADAKLSALDAEAAGIQKDRDELTRRQSLLEDEVGMIERKITGEDQKLYSGTVTGVKELQALQDEIASLKRRQGTLEDDILEVMEAAEPVDAELESIAARRASTESTRAEATEEIDRSEGEIDAEIEVETGARNAAAAAIPADLLGTYDRIRAERGGVGIARFAGNRCEGCHLSLSAVEVDQIKKQPADAIVTCGSCERILAR